MNAVITADIVDYTRLSDREVNVILENVSQLINELQNTRFNINSNFSVRRGDNIQGEFNDPAEALKAALLLKTTVNRGNYEKENRKSKIIDIRISIGIGEIVKRNSIDESSGDAYIFSGRTLDNMKKDKRLIAIKTPDDKMNAEFEAELRLLEVIMERWTVTTSEILYWTLWGLEEKKIAEKLGVKQPAISQGKKRAGWSGIKALLDRYEQLMKEVK